MRSSRSDPDPLDPGPAGFAHRGLHDGSAFPENSLIAFAAALERGAGIECDLRLTRDNAVIVFHDADSRRMCGRSLAIGGSTLDEIRRLRLGEGPVPTLESLFALVAARTPLLLEIKVQADVWRWIPALRPALTRYAGPFGVMSFDPRIARLLKTNLPAVRRGLVIRDSLPPIKRWIAMKIADPQFLAVEAASLGEPWVADARSRMPVYSWTIRTPDMRQTSAAFADALIWEADGRP